MTFDALIDRMAEKWREVPGGSDPDARRFSGLSGDIDAVWANGSLHHIPFDEAREECAAILDRLKPGGRWIELAYPRERWVREGSPPFDQWGRLTDGERTPWAEWYDIEKLKLQLDAGRIEPTLDYRHQSAASGRVS